MSSTVSRSSLPHTPECFLSAVLSFHLVKCQLIELFICLSVLVGWSVTYSQQNICLVSLPPDPYPRAFNFTLTPVLWVILPCFPGGHSVTTFLLHSGFLLLLFLPHTLCASPGLPISPPTLARHPQVHL